MAAAHVEAPDAALQDAAVLVVDDNAAKRLAVRAMLAPLGHAGSSAFRQAESAASATSSWAAEGSAVETRVCKM